jgi:hypothetical protein
MTMRLKSAEPRTLSIEERARYPPVCHIGRLDSTSESVATKLHEPLVADSKVVRDLMQNHAPHLRAKERFIVSVAALKRTMEECDLVWKHAGVEAPPSRERHALIKPKKMLARRWLLLDDDLDVRQRLP